jgi:Lysozyme like domain
MPTLSASEIKGYAKNAGFSGNDLDIAVAVALAESEGNTKAHNGKGEDDSYGLWQINMFGSMGPGRRRDFALASDADLYQPDVNAKAAYKIWKSQGWKRGWTTYSSGKYIKFLPAAKAAPIKAPRDGIEDKLYDNTVEPIKDATGGIGETINGLSSSIFKVGTNFAGMGIAIALLAVGVVFLVMSSSNAKKAVNVAANVVPGGKVVKAGIKKATKA